MARMKSKTTKKKTKSKREKSAAAASHSHHEHRQHDHSHGHGSSVDHAIFHPAHREGVVRLRRARGHLDKVIQMVEEGRHCTDILQQLSAVISALGGCRTLLFSGHLKTCLRPALKPGNESLIDEIEKLSSRVMKAN